jgi:cytochrome c553
MTTNSTTSISPVAAASPCTIAPTSLITHSQSVLPVRTSSSTTAKRRRQWRRGGSLWRRYATTTTPLFASPSVLRSRAATVTTFWRAATLPWCRCSEDLARRTRADTKSSSTTASSWHGSCRRCRHNRRRSQVSSLPELINQFSRKEQFMLSAKNKKQREKLRTGGCCKTRELSSLAKLIIH